MVDVYHRRLLRTSVTKKFDVVIRITDNISFDGWRQNKSSTTGLNFFFWQNHIDDDPDIEHVDKKNEDNEFEMIVDEEEKNKSNDQNDFNPQKDFWRYINNYYSIDIYSSWYSMTSEITRFIYLRAVLRAWTNISLNRSISWFPFHLISDFHAVFKFIDPVKDSLVWSEIDVTLLLIASSSEYLCI